MNIFINQYFLKSVILTPYFKSTKNYLIFTEIKYFQLIRKKVVKTIKLMVLSSDKIIY